MVVDIGYWFKGSTNRKGYLAVGLALPGGQGETKPLTGTAGEEITLLTGVTGLHGHYEILWSHGEDHRVIVDFDNGVLKQNTSERYHLNRKTGSLTIRPLCINDTGLYLGQIINGNGSWHYFNLTVVVAALSETITVSGEEGKNLTLIKGLRNWCPSACRGDRGDNGVV
ncbi:hypothetical protein PAMA_015817 [Pampus argenteus]